MFVRVPTGELIAAHGATVTGGYTVTVLPATASAARFPADFTRLRPPADFSDATDPGPFGATQVPSR